MNTQLKRFAIYSFMFKISYSFKIIFSFLLASIRDFVNCTETHDIFLGSLLSSVLPKFIFSLNIGVPINYAVSVYEYPTLKIMLTGLPWWRSG